MSSLRGRKRGGKLVGTKEAGPSSRTRRATGEPMRPLEGKVIYLDVVRKPPKLVDKLKADLRELGARVEPFLSKDITHLFSDRLEAAEISKSQAYPSGASPAVSTPSPFQQWKDSGAADSPADPSSSSNNVRMMTRGRAIANKADTSSKTRGSTDVLNNARNMGIPVKCLDKIMNYCEWEITKLRETSKKKGETSGQKPKKKARQLQRHFLKVEDISRRYRPVSKEMDVWPRMVVDRGDKRSPFVGSVPPAQAQRDEPAATTPAKTPQKVADPPQGSRKSAQKSAKKFVRKPRTPVAKKTKEAGYCECCRGRYSDLNEHVESTTHQYFIKNRSNYCGLDAMISEGPNMEQFLRDCLQYQESSTNSSSEMSQTPTQADDDVVFISEMDPAGQPQAPDIGADPTTKTAVQQPNPQEEHSKSPEKGHSQQMTSTPQKKKSTSGSKRKRLSTSQDKAAGELTGTRLSPRLRKGNQPLDAAEKGPACQQPQEKGDDVIMIISSPPKLNPVGDDTVPGDPASNMPIEGQLGEGGATHNIPETVESPTRPKRVAAMTPLSPRSRLSLTRRRRRQMLDMSPASPPSKRKKRGVAQGAELGMIDCELPQEASTPRRGRSLQGCAALSSSNAQGGKKGGGHTNKQSARSDSNESLGSVKKVKKKQLEQQCHDCTSPPPQADVQPGSQHEQSHFAKPHQENKKFPQGAENTSSTKPFLGHSHTDFGLDPVNTPRQRLTRQQSEITGSEDERLRTIFRSDPMSEGNFEGFSNEEIHETELLHESFTKNNDSRGNKETLRERLKSAALDVVYVPTSELGALPQDDGSESDSESNDGSVEVDIVFQKVENFPSEGSEWEAQVQGFMTKLDEALEDREKKAKMIQDDLRRKEQEMERKRAELERKEAELERKRARAERRELERKEIAESIERSLQKENTQQSGLNNVSGDQVVTSASRKVCEPRRVEILTESDRNRSEELPVETSSENLVSNVQKTHPCKGRQLRPRKKVASPQRGEIERHVRPALSPVSKTVLQATQSTVSPGNVIQGSPTKCSTPKSRRSSLGKNGHPRVTFSPKVTVEEQEIIINHYVHDGEEDEVSFPKLSSPSREGWNSSPVRKRVQGEGEPKVTTPTTTRKVGRLRRRSLSNTDSTRPLLFLRLSVSPSRNKSPPCPMSPPTSPCKKNAAPPQSPFKKNASPPPSPFKSPRNGALQSRTRKSPPIFALLYDEGSRKRGLAPILVTNRRPNFSREILQPSLRLSLSKRRRRRASRTLAALNLSLPHIFDVFEFHDETSADDGDEGQGRTVETAECGTQTPPRRTRARAASFPRSGGTTSRLRRVNPARRKLCIPTEGGGDASTARRVSQKSSSATTRGGGSGPVPDLPGTSGHIPQGESSGKASGQEEGIQGTFEGSNLTRPFDLPLSFYM